LIFADIKASDHIEDHLFDLLHSQSRLFVIVKNVYLHLLDLLFKLFHHLALIVDIACGESSDDVFDFTDLTSKGCTLQVPVVEYEPQMIPVSQLLRYLAPVGVSVAHDGDQHVEEMDHDYEGCEAE